MASQDDAQDIETATTALDIQPDSKTRRYDRQLRLWAATGQAALENARILVLSGSATSTSILKNLVLPGIGHFTILDDQTVSAADAGNNFFLEGDASIGKPRAEEAVRLLLELNEGVQGTADTASLERILETDPSYLTSFTVVIAHNLEPKLLHKLAQLLWSDESYPTLLVVRSAGFLAEFFIQFHEHQIIESHSETAPSLRIDNAFPSLLEYASSLDFENMDVTEHSHIPYVIILVHVLEKWKKSHDGKPPQTYAEKQEFKKLIQAMKKKSDEENFEEAEAQAYRAWTSSGVPSDISALFDLPALTNLTPASSPFYHLLSALRAFASAPPHTLPLSSTLPDMKANTTNYIALQTLYKRQAEAEKARFRTYLDVPVDDALVDSFVKNAHGIKLLKGKRWGALDSDPQALADAAMAAPRQLATHLALSALSQSAGSPADEQTLTTLAQAMLPAGTELPAEFAEAVGEVVRAPFADLPNTAAFLGGLVAQEAIKMITKQYVPVNGYCVVDLVETSTGVIG